jgi:hypothetical protein
MDESILEQPWFHDPFRWYEETTDKYVISVQISDTRALDILAGLYDIYKSFQRNDKQGAIQDLNALAVLLIAHSMGVANEAIEEILVHDAQKNMDSGLLSLLEETNDK